MPADANNNKSLLHLLTRREAAKGIDNLNLLLMIEDEQVLEKTLASLSLCSFPETLLLARALAKEKKVREGSTLLICRDAKTFIEKYGFEIVMPTWLSTLKGKINNNLSIFLSYAKNYENFIVNMRGFPTSQANLLFTYCVSRQEFEAQRAIDEAKYAVSAFQSTNVHLMREIWKVILEYIGYEDINFVKSLNSKVSYELEEKPVLTIDDFFKRYDLADVRRYKNLQPEYDIFKLLLNLITYYDPLSKAPEATIYPFSNPLLNVIRENTEKLVRGVENELKIRTREQNYSYRYIPFVDRDTRLFRPVGSLEEFFMAYGLSEFDYTYFQNILKEHKYNLEIFLNNETGDVDRFINRSLEVPASQHVQFARKRERALAKSLERIDILADELKVFIEAEVKPEGSGSLPCIVDLQNVLNTGKSPQKFNQFQICFLTLEAENLGNRIPKEGALRNIYNRMKAITDNIYGKNTISALLRQRVGSPAPAKTAVTSSMGAGVQERKDAPFSFPSLKTPPMVDDGKSAKGSSSIEQEKKEEMKQQQAVAERSVQERLEKEAKEKAEKERQEAEKRAEQEHQRRAAEEQARRQKEAAERVEKERQEAEKRAEQERQRRAAEEQNRRQKEAAERVEKERQEAEKRAEQEHQQKEAKRKAEQDRIDQQRIEKERQEAEKEKAEQAHRQKETEEQERQQKAAEEKAEKERQEAEQRRKAALPAEDKSGKGSSESSNAATEVEKADRMFRDTVDNLKGEYSQEEWEKVFPIVEGFYNQIQDIKKNKINQNERYQDAVKTFKKDMMPYNKNYRCNRLIRILIITGFTLIGLGVGFYFASPTVILAGSIGGAAIGGFFARTKADDPQAEKIIKDLSAAHFPNATLGR